MKSKLNPYDVYRKARKLGLTLSGYENRPDKPFDIFSLVDGVPQNILAGGLSLHDADIWLDGYLSGQTVMQVTTQKDNQHV